MLYNKSSNSSLYFNMDTIDTSSLLFYSLDCLREYTESTRSLMMDIYSGNEYILSESKFSDFLNFNKKFDFGKLVKQIIDFFNKAIIDLFKRFKVIIMDLNYLDSTIKVYEKKIKSYNKVVKIKFPHYNYRYLEDAIPNPNLYLQFIEEFKQTKERITEISKCGNKAEFINRILSYKEELSKNTNEDYYNKIRKSILDTGRKNIISIFDVITKENYAEKLHGFFRSGLVDPIVTEVDITPDSLHESLNRFINAKNLIKSAENNKDKIQTTSDKVIKDLTKIPIKGYIDESKLKIDKDVEYHVDTILNIEVEHLTKLCEIYILAFSAKLNAILEALKTDKKILYRAIEDIILEDGGN